MFAIRAVRPARFVQSVRKFSAHSAEEAKAEVDKWKKISIVATPLVLTWWFYALFLDSSGHPHNERPELYQIKNKPFPWQCRDCGFFETECWKACKGESTGSGH